MRFSHFGSFFSATPRQVDPGVALAAGKLIEQWGDAAYDHANDLSRREDAGFVVSPSQGHWWRVRQEIGRRRGLVENEPQARFAA